MSARATFGMAASIAALFAAAAMAYVPGLGGPYLIDDYTNLTGLGGLRDEPSWYNALKYVLSGVSTELGRPVALLSFAAQWASWDQRPQDFIAVNIALHLLNGLLWFWCVMQLQRLGALPRACGLPLLACALWLLMPMHVATVLYIVQRMTLLATTFVLGGLSLYLAGRTAAIGGAVTRGYVLMSLGLGVALVLGTLSKETAALAPLLLLALEATLLRLAPRPPHWRRWAGAFLWSPALLLLAYLALRFPAFLQGYELRAFSLAERLLTEARLLCTYAAEAFLPQSSARLHYDDYAISTSVLAPWTTLPAVAAWAALTVVAITRRRTWPVFSFAVAWFLLGHLLESTFVPLELGFAHRNYLPLLGVSLAAAHGFLQLAAVPSLQRARGFLHAGGLAYLGALLTCLVLAAGLWGQPLAQARQWAQRQPDSHRAVNEYKMRLLEHQQIEAALDVNRVAAARWPGDVVFALSLYGIGCSHPGAAPALIELRDTIGQYRGPALTGAVGALLGIAQRAIDGRCPLHKPADVLAVLDAMLEAPRFTHHRFALSYATANLLDAMGDRARALERLEYAAELDPQIPLLQLVAVRRLQQGDVSRAREHLQTLEISARITPLKRWLFRKEIRGTRQLIELYESTP